MLSKKILLTIIFSLSVFAISAQTWTCEKIASDIEFFNNAKSGNNKWAQAIKTAFPLNQNDQIELNYVLCCSDTLSRTELIALTEGWLGVVFTNAKDQIQESNENKTLCVGELGQVAFEQKFIGATRIMAPLEISVLYKDNRVRLTLLTRNYRMAYANVGTLESGTMIISSTFPFQKSKHKSAYAMAYINTISKLLNLADGYLNYLNKNTAVVDETIPEW